MISQAEFKERRVKLAQSLPADSLAILSSAKALIRNGDAHFPFRQNSHFYYLTGFNEPEALLLVMAGSRGESILFSRPREPQAELWTGKRLGQEGALADLGMDTAFPIAKAADELPRILSGKSSIYCLIGQDITLEKTLINAIKIIKNQQRAGMKAPFALCDLDPILSEMRLFKSPQEILCLRKAIDSSVEAHKRAMRTCKNLDNEYQVAAELTYEMMAQACADMAYTPIVASGANACILHYTANNQPIKSNDLILIDAGGEYQGYAADITRTFPVRGQFSKAQKSIYDCVLRAQRAGIAVIKPGVAWNKVQEVIVRYLTQGLCHLGLLHGSIERLIHDGAYKPFYMHNSGHWLGLDVHDCGAYKQGDNWRNFEPGMVLTVEPGLYIAPSANVDERFQGIGVRIEDDVLVTQSGHEVLSAALPVEIDAIEALMRE